MTKSPREGRARIGAGLVRAALVLAGLAVVLGALGFAIPTAALDLFAVALILPLLGLGLSIAGHLVLREAWSMTGLAMLANAALGVAWPLYWTLGTLAFGP